MIRRTRRLRRGALLNMRFNRRTSDAYRRNDSNDSCSDDDTLAKKPSQGPTSGKQATRPVRIRVTMQGAEHVQGLKVGTTYGAHIKRQWPDTAWLENTGLPYICFLLLGMYELLDDERAT
jgi:hypothetical protein